MDRYCRPDQTEAGNQPSTLAMRLYLAVVLAMLLGLHVALLTNFYDLMTSLF